jgi:hypothetical protein
MLGLAPVLDFDGTLTHLGVDWVGLRQELGVDRIDDLWSRAGNWNIVAEAEIAAASVAAAVAPVATILSAVRCFAVLTSNDARAVTRFVERFPALRDRLAIVVGREELGGPKTDFARFEVGMQQCLEATEQHRGGERAVYVGDSPYELDFALRLGLNVVDVEDLVLLHGPGEG